MGTFNTTKTFYAPQSLIPIIARDIAINFTDDGYEVQSQDLISGGCDISITKGGIFKAVLGMKTALKVNIQPTAQGIQINAGVGIFGQQAIPTIISMFIFWPVLITQISGLIKQSKMDDRVITIATETIAREVNKTNRTTTTNPAGTSKYCNSCGKQLETDAVFCSGCGNKV